MADDRNDRAPQDRRVNVHEDRELRFRTTRWTVTPDARRRAVHKVGVSADAVERELGGAAGSA